MLTEYLKNTSIERLAIYVFAVLFAATILLETLFAGYPAGAVINFLGLLVTGLGLTVFISQSLRQEIVETDEDPEAGVSQQGSANSGGLETIGRLAGGVAHDFNNSLMVLLNCIELLRGAEDSIERHALLADMESAAKGAQSTAQQLMSLSKQGSTPGQPSDPRAALRSIASNLRRMLPENITVRDSLRGTPAVALVSGQFEQTVLNICLDAKDAMPNGGELILRCHKDPLEDVVVIEIEDNAQRTALPEQNPVTYEAVTSVGGDITLQSLDGGGTNITLTLPIAERDTAIEPEERCTKDGVSQSLLLLDDNELVLTMLSARLEQAGYNVTTAVTVNQALELSTSQQFDALVSDAVLPDGNPKGVIESFRCNSSGPIVICSGYAKNDPILEALEIESAVFLQKPFSTDELIMQLADTNSDKNRAA